MRVARRLLIVAAMLALTGAQAAFPGALQIEGYRVEGSTLSVAVSASGDAPVEGVLFATVVTAAGTVELGSDVRVEPGGTRTVTLDAGAEVLKVIVVGAVIDDGSPF